MSNVINCMVFSQHFSYDDEQFRQLLQTISEVIRFNSGLSGQVSASRTRTSLIKEVYCEVFLQKWNQHESHKNCVGTRQCASIFQMYNVFPWIMERLPGPQHTIFKHIEELKVFIKMKIQEHKETLDPSSPRDYIDCFLLRMEQVSNMFIYSL